MQDQARAVIIGSGIAGSSIAYHLSRSGWRDIVVLEQGPLFGGTTSHAPGLVGQLRSSVSLTKMLMYSVELYRQLQVDDRPGYFEIVVVATGVWSPRLGRMAGVSIPLVPMQHQYAMTGSLSELAGGVSMPNLRDPDKLVYFRQDGQSLVLGGYERDPAAFDVDAIT